MMETQTPATGGAPPLEAPFNPLLITFLVKRQGRELQVRCRGCREVIPWVAGTSGHLRGAIELDGRLVPVIDAEVYSGADRTKISHCNCILVFEHLDDARPLHTGVIVYDIEEVMQLAAGTFQMTAQTDTNANMDLVLEMCDSPRPHALLRQVHRDLMARHPSGAGCH